MSGPHKNRRFSRIETEARLPDGTILCNAYDFPEGASKAEYDKIDADLVAEHGNNGSRTIETFIDSEVPLGNLDGAIQQAHDHSQRFFSPK